MGKKKKKMRNEKELGKMLRVRLARAPWTTSGPLFSAGTRSSARMRRKFDHGKSENQQLFRKRVRDMLKSSGSVRSLRVLGAPQALSSGTARHGERSRKGELRALGRYETNREKRPSLV